MNYFELEIYAKILPFRTVEDADKLIIYLLLKKGRSVYIFALLMKNTGLMNLRFGFIRLEKTQISGYKISKSKFHHIFPRKRHMSC